jgi:ribosomal protein S18 acetylase RimI-like enzyme
MAAAYAEYRPPSPSRMWTMYEADVRDVRGRLADSTLVVAEGDGRVLGAVTYYPDASKDAHGWPASYAYFRLLAVAPAARGLGIGRLLTEECVRRARAAGCAALGLHTTSLMTVARAMYERMGFVRAPEHDVHPVPQLHVMAYRLALAR